MKKNVGLTACSGSLVTILAACGVPHSNRSEKPSPSDRPAPEYPIQHRGFTKLVGLQFRIQYKAGATNRAADALARHAP